VDCRRSVWEPQKRVGCRCAKKSFCNNRPSSGHSSSSIYSVQCHWSRLFRGGGMSDECSAVPRRFRIARRWQWAAAAASVLFVLASFVGWPLGYLWPSVIGFVAFLPSVWLFSIKCYNCRWPAFTNYKAEEALKQDQRLWTRFWGKEHGGVSLPLPNKCTKCGASFV